MSSIRFGDDFEYNYSHIHNRQYSIRVNDVHEDIVFVEFMSKEEPPFETTVFMTVAQMRELNKKIEDFLEKIDQISDGSKE